MFTIYINGVQIKTHKNQTILQACTELQIEIPKFCFYENLQIAGNCRMCLVEVENSPKPIASCAMPILNNMKIFTNTPLVQKARESILEFLLINHPLDCPICDQASECDLQDQTFLFGTDQTRFFSNKKTIEDKNCGPFIKTIMTRCIHCTRCVRFINEICKIDHLGIIGRSSKTEIHFYHSSIFYSEFSGNLIDLCPVGALTSKPFSFKTRVWELKRQEGIDILDAICSNIKIDSFNNEIVRILPRTNFQINKEWISNRTRFFFDSLKYQRIQYPLLKENNGQYKQISWSKMFSLLFHQLIIQDGSNIQGIVGNLIDIESLFIFKKVFNQLGSSNILYENDLKNKFIKSKNDLTSNFLFNKPLNTINQSDLCLIINSDIRKEASILNIHLINSLKESHFKIAYIGPKIDFTYKVQHIGLSLKTFYQILIGKHFFCTKIKKAKNPFIIVGKNILYQKNGLLLIENIKKLVVFKKQIHFLNINTSFIHFNEIFFFTTQLKNKKANFLFLYNTNIKKKSVNKKRFIIYQGHHFTENAEQSTLILPGLSFLEKKGIYINLEGRIQKNNKILNLNTAQREDIFILKSIYQYISYKNKKNKKKFKFTSILPHLYKKNLNLNTILVTKNKIDKIQCHPLNFMFKHNYYYNILEKYSKILTHSNKVLLKSHSFNFN
jgi:NADH-quinone oxidoreductase chain G